MAAAGRCRTRSQQLLRKRISGSIWVVGGMVWSGRGGPVPPPQPAAVAKANQRFDLVRGEWRLQRDSLVTADGRTIALPGFQAADWLPATVPGTVLTSYLDD